MSYKKLQPSPQAGPRGNQIRIATPESGDSSRRGSDHSNSSESSEHSVDGGAISGLALALTVSAGFWAGIAWIVVRA